jgi:Protein of unknown function (DUF3224)
MSAGVNATFEVTDWNEEPFDDATEAAKVTCAKVSKNYSGDITGSSFTEWLMAYREDGTATFVGLERISGEVDGKRGSFVVQHIGKFEDGAATAELQVVAGSGADGLAGVSGGGDFVADPSGKVNLKLSFS